MRISERRTQMAKKNYDEALPPVAKTEGFKKLPKGAQTKIIADWRKKMKAAEAGKKNRVNPELRATYAEAVGDACAYFLLGLNPVSNDDELCDRLNTFFKSCQENEQLPSIEKMLLSLGKTRDWYGNILSGRQIGFSSNTIQILMRAKEIIAAIDADLAAQGKIQPVVYIFRAKNFYGMSDNVDVNYHVDIGEKSFSQLIRESKALPGASDNEK